MEYHEQIQKPAETNSHSKRLSPAERKEIGVRLTGIAEAINEPLSALRLDLYLQALSDIPFEPLKAALENLLVNSRWFPKIPDIREAVLGKPQEVEKDAANLNSERAWNKILWISQRWGIDEETGDFYPIMVKGEATLPPSLTPAEDYALLQIGWWQAINNQEPEKLTWMRKDFIAAHKRHIETHGLRELPGVANTKPQGQIGDGGLSSLKDILKGVQ